MLCSLSVKSMHIHKKKCIHSLCSTSVLVCDALTTTTTSIIIMTIAFPLSQIYVYLRYLSFLTCSFPLFVLFLRFSESVFSDGKGRKRDMVLCNVARFSYSCCAPEKPTPHKIDLRFRHFGGMRNMKTFTKVTRTMVTR